MTIVLHTTRLNASFFPAPRYHHRLFQRFSPCRRFANKAPLLPYCLLLVSALPLTVLFAEDATVHRGYVGGYTSVEKARVEETYNAGYSMYVAAWPLQREYPGQNFQSGLFGTWMHPRHDKPLPVKYYSDIDAALIVTPPAGLEVGYVPIATRQELRIK